MLGERWWARYAFAHSTKNFSSLDTAACKDDNRHTQTIPRGLHVKNAFTFAAALAAIAVSLPAQAGTLWPDVPAEIGVRRIGELGLVPYRCVDGPADNYYHGAWYDVPPALYRGYAYRPYYRYTAYRVIPRNYFCTER
jgi:hypothetical protein